MSLKKLKLLPQICFVYRALYFLENRAHICRSMTNLVFLPITIRCCWWGSVCLLLVKQRFSVDCKVSDVKKGCWLLLNATHSNNIPILTARCTACWLLAHLPAAMNFPFSNGFAPLQFLSNHSTSQPVSQPCKQTKCFYKFQNLLTLNS